jgi:VWFA-related protein
LGVSQNKELMSIPFSMRCAVVFLTLAVGSIGLPAQPPAQPSTLEAIPKTQPDNKIYLDVVVSPKSGKPVAGLEKQDFTILDNNVAQPIASFQPLGSPSAPVEVLLVVDAVNTTYSNLTYERDQIDLFFKSNGGHLDHPVSLAIFTDTGVQMQQGESTDGNELSASLDHAAIGLREVRRDSQYGGQDRFNLSLNALHSLIVKEAARPGRKLIFWISPGWPLLSGPRIDLDSKQEQQLYAQIVGLSTLLRRNDITLYSIDPLGMGQNVGWEFAYQEYLNGVKKPNQVQLGDLSLQVLAVQSGGLALTATNDIANHIRQCMDDAAEYYRISYDAPPTEPRDGDYHKVDVKISKPGLIARTRTGYYSASTTPPQ